MLNTLAQKLKAKRMAAGALSLVSLEAKIHLDSSEFSDLIRKKTRDSLIPRQGNLKSHSYKLRCWGEFFLKNSWRHRVYDLIKIVCCIINRRHLYPSTHEIQKSCFFVVEEGKGIKWSVKISSSGVLWLRHLDQNVLILRSCSALSPFFCGILEIRWISRITKKGRSSRLFIIWTGSLQNLRSLPFSSYHSQLLIILCFSAEYFLLWQCVGNRYIFGHYNGLASSVYTHFT